MAHFNWCIDGGVIGLYLMATMVVGIMVRKYVGKVEHFLVAGREVDVYLGIASLAATEFGVVTCMYTAENGYKYGFAGATPGILMALATFFVGSTGFCIDPLRHAGVMTIPELFEQRFGPRVRWAAGVVIVLGGLLNMGVFLRITGEFLVLVAGFDLADLERNVLLMMTALLLLGTIYTVVGGMLSVLVTDFLQFLVMSAGLLAVTVLILLKIGWAPLAATVVERQGAGGFNPFLCDGMGWQYVVFNALECLAGGHSSCSLEGNLYDENLRIPLLLYCPALLPRGRIIHQQVSQVDIMPTLVELLGLSMPGPVAGRSLVPLIHDRTQDFVEEAYAETSPCGWQALESDRRMMWCVRRPPWKLIRYHDPRTGDREELFNVACDPGEEHDVLPAQPEIRAALAPRLDLWVAGEAEVPFAIE